MNANSVVTFGTGADAVSFAPQELVIDIQSVDYDSGRNADGTMERNMLGEKRKAEISLPPLHSAELRRILNAVCGTENVKFFASFPDPWSSTGVYSGEFYVGDRSSNVYNFALDLWTDVKFNIVEY